MAKDIRECLLEQAEKISSVAGNHLSRKNHRGDWRRCGRSITLHGMIYLMPFAMC